MSNTPYTVDVVERMKEALKQRTCLWETDIRQALGEIESLKAQIEALKAKSQKPEETTTDRKKK